MRWAWGTVMAGSSLGVLASVLLRRWAGPFAEPAAIGLFATAFVAASRVRWRGAARLVSPTPGRMSPQP